MVLETQQQYDAAGLQPVPEGTVPTIPEPKEWALIFVALLVLAYVLRAHAMRGRRARRRSCILSGVATRRCSRCS